MSAARAFLLLAGLSILAGCDRHPKQEARAVAPTISAKPQLQRLDDLIRFDDPKECTFAGPMARLFASLIRTKADGSIAPGKPEIPAAYASAFGKLHSSTRQNMLTVTLPAAGEWKGLRIISISSSAVAQGDTGWWAIGFAAPKKSVIEKLGQAGMPLPANGIQPADENKPDGWGVEVQSYGDMSYLVCS